MVIIFFLYIIACIPEDVEGTIAGDTLQDGAVQRWSNDFAVNNEHNVHCATFLDVFEFLWASSHRTWS